ncbi:MAG TPA: VOC family protein [Thermoanaerobaculia bacterium]|nr:VOC family protein [Thermoanaerobaculia bacterium]
MHILGVNHINLAGSAELIERCRAFYIEVLGLTEGHRPQFMSRGFWLYAEDQPIVHLRIKEEGRDTRGTNALDHIAFTCDGFDAAMERLRERGIAFTVDPARDTKPAQLFFEDPSGLGLELQFL